MQKAAASIWGNKTILSTVRYYQRVRSSGFNNCRLVLIKALLAGIFIFASQILLAQERPKAAKARQAYEIDVETHIDLLVGAEEAHNHLHEVIMVCGSIVDTYFERSSPTLFGAGYYAGQRNTYVYFDKPRGDHDFVAIVHGTVRKDLPKKPESLKGQRVCVFGEVSMFRQRAAMLIVRAEQFATKGPPEKANE